MIPRRSLLLLALLLAVCRITVGYRRFSAPGRDSAIATISASSLVLDPPRDLSRVRANPTVSIERSPFRFTDIAESAGICFVHVSGMTEVKHFPTAYGSGVAMFDFDSDGKLDLYFATATQLPPGIAPSGPNRLYRNLGAGCFEDATGRSGLGFAGYCQGLVTTIEMARGSSWPPATPALTSIPITSAAESPVAISTTTVTSTSWSITRTVRRPCSAMTPRRGTIGFARAWWARAAIATPSARVEIEAGDRTSFRQRNGGSSYASSHDPRLLIGLGDAFRARRITVRWPSGRVDLYLDLPAGAEVSLPERGERSEPSQGPDGNERHFIWSATQPNSHRTRCRGRHRAARIDGERIRNSGTSFPRRFIAIPLNE
jgi:hypothetical protein